MLNDLINENTTQLKKAEENIAAAQTGPENQQAALSRIQREYGQLIGWEDAYDRCSLEERKRLVYWIKRMQEMK